MTTKRSDFEPHAARRGFSPQDPALERELRSLQRPSTWATLRALGLDWIVIVTAAAVSWKVFTAYGVIALSLGVYLLALLAIGSRQKALENLMHEGTHFNLTRNRRLNDWVAVYLAGLWISPSWGPEGERPGHVGDHHGNFGDKERDGEFFGYQKRGLGELPAAQVLRSLWILTRTFLRLTYWRFDSNRRSLSRPTRLLLCLGIAALLWALGLLVPLLLYWIAPYCLVYLPMRYISEVSEHMALGYGTEFDTTRNKLGWFQEHVMQPHGDGYHLVHHMYPRIPHYNLARAHRLLLRDPVYQRGHHCYGLVIPSKGRPSTLADLLRTGRPSIADLRGDQGLARSATGSGQ